MKTSINGRPFLSLGYIFLWRFCVAISVATAFHNFDKRLYDSRKCFLRKGSFKSALHTTFALKCMYLQLLPYEYFFWLLELHNLHYNETLNNFISLLEIWNFYEMDQKMCDFFRKYEGFCQNKLLLQPFSSKLAYFLYVL